MEYSLAVSLITNKKGGMKMKIKGYEYPAALGGTGYSLFKLNEEVWNEVTIITPPNWELTENKDGLPMLVNRKTGDKATNISGRNGIPYITETQSGKIYKCRVEANWGGRRKGAGAKKTLPVGAKKRALAMTDEEREKVREFLKKLRSMSNK